MKKIQLYTLNMVKGENPAKSDLSSLEILFWIGSGFAVATLLHVILFL